MNPTIFPFIAAVIMAISTHTATPAALPANESGKHIVCIDAGHGADDSGAVSNDLEEAAITLAIANKLNNLLLMQGYQTVQTRPDSNTNPSNSERAEFCNHGHAQILISIHLNYNDDSTVDYTQGLYGTEEKDKKLSDFLTNILASQLHVSNGETTDFEDNLMLKAHMPATLQEVLFISSSIEYPQLQDGSREQQIAQALDDAVNAWFLQNK